MLILFHYLIARFKEPSGHAGLAACVIAVGQLIGASDPSQQQAYIGAIVMGALAFLRKG